MRTSLFRVTAVCLALAGATALQGQDAPQSASSANHFLASFEFGSGGHSISANHVLDASFGSGVAVNHAVNATHVLMGGFSASVNVPTSGKPWLSSVEPRFTEMRSAAVVTIHGTELFLATTVKIGGQPATILSSTADKITVRVPNQNETGFRPVTVKSNTAETTLPQGLGILPLVYEENAAASDVPFTLVFKGTQGDTVALVIGVVPTTPIPLLGMGYGLAMDPSAMMAVSTMGILNPNGEVRMPFPALRYGSGSVLAQALFISGNPAYAPGAFSNLIRL